MKSGDDLAARLAALEFLVRNLYGVTILNQGGDPLESALATQSATMMGLQKKFDAVPANDPSRERLSLTVGHVNRILEELVQGFEQGGRSATSGPHK